MLEGSRCPRTDGRRAGVHGALALVDELCDEGAPSSRLQAATKAKNTTRMSLKGHSSACPRPADQDGNWQHRDPNRGPPRIVPRAGGRCDGVGGRAAQGQAGTQRPPSLQEKRAGPWPECPLCMQGQPLHRKVLCPSIGVHGGGSCSPNPGTGPGGRWMGARVGHQACPQWAYQGDGQTLLSCSTWVSWTV